MYYPDGDFDSDEGPILGCKWRATFGDLDSGDNLHGNFDYRLDDYAKMYDSDCDYNSYGGRISTQASLSRVNTTKF
ncbi:hypothetical protein PM082_020697 [Marasmius tenuissimus]|nr:hypothetical protein PM082_020697 [Marasmius tenuissimus]